MSADNNSKINNDHSSVSKNTRVIASSKKIGYFKKIFGKAKSSSTTSVIIEKNGIISKIDREQSKSYLTFGEKLVSLIGMFKINEAIIDHTPFNLSYEFNKNDKYPLLSKDNQKISSFFSIDLRIDPINPTVIFQSFPGNSNITTGDIYSLLDQRIKSVTSASISEQNSKTIRSSKFQTTFLETLAPQFKSHTELIGCEVFSWTPPIFGSSQEEENNIELAALEHKNKIAEIENNIENLNHRGDQNTEGTNINVGRDFIIKSSHNNSIGLLLSIIAIGFIITGIIYYIQ